MTIRYIFPVLVSCTKKTLATLGMTVLEEFQEVIRKNRNMPNGEVNSFNSKKDKID
jgi:hypothetical protein